MASPDSAEALNGFIGLIKPPGMSSNDAVGFVRRLLPRGVKVGHGGTLDPDAAGVLPVCIGRATRLFDYIVDKRKTYIASLVPGIVTDTQDASGAVLERCPAGHITEADVQAALPAFIGEIDQIPPAYSAIKRDGRRMYDLARKGQQVALEPRRVRVDGISLVAREGEGAFLLRVDCGKGVYIRTLCHDIGRKLGVGAHMGFLLRTRAGRFDIADCVTVETLAESGVSTFLKPCDWPLDHLSAVTVDEAYATAALNGVPVPSSRYSGEAAPDAPLRVYLAGRFAGIGRTGAEGALRFCARV